jgi:hypothetical protein
VAEDDGASRLGGLNWKGQFRTPSLAKCGAEECGFIWTFAYLPLPVTTWAELASAAACPMCGSTKVLAC